jgi:gliding motility-associated-like protein
MIDNKFYYWISFWLMVLLSWTIDAQPCTPVVNLGNDIRFCAGNSVTLDATDPNCPGTSYLWNNGPGTTSISTAAQLTVSHSGTYYVYLTNGTATVVDSIRIFVDQAPVVFLGSDRSICFNSQTTLRLSQQHSSFQYLWSDGSTADSLVVQQAGTYWLQVTNSCGSFRDTIEIFTDNYPLIDLPQRIIVCDDTSTFLKANSYNGYLVWQDGSTLDSLHVFESASYWAVSTNSCGSAYDTAEVIIGEGVKLNLPDTVFFCPGAGAVLSSGLSSNILNTGSSLWSTGHNGDTLNINSGGTYWYQFTDSCQSYSDTVEVVQRFQSAMIDLGPDTAICEGDPFFLSAFYPSSTYLWSTGDTTPVISVSQAGRYWVQVNNGCGLSYDTIHLSARPAPRPAVADTLRFCNNSSVVAVAGPNTHNQRYRWSTGDTLNHLRFSSPGNYWVERIGICGPVRKHFLVVQDQPRILHINPDSLNCVPARSLSLDSGFFNTDSIAWSNGMRNAKRTSVRDTGWHWVMVTNACGTYYDSIRLDHLLPPLKPATSAFFCTGGNTNIGSPIDEPKVDYLWNTGDTSFQITVNQAGTYWLRSSNQCDTVVDSIFVRELSPNSKFNITGDSIGCRGQLLNLSVGNFPADSVVWSNGQRGTSISIRGNFNQISATIYNRCGIYHDTIFITRIRPPQPGLRDTSFCHGASIQLSANSPRATRWQWSTGDTTSSITVNQAGWYSVRLINDCFERIDSCYVSSSSPLPAIDLGKDTIFCQGTLSLDAQVNNPLASYLWQDGSNSPQYLVTGSGLYHVTISDSCNTISDSIFVLITGSPSLTLGTEIRYCNSNSLTLNAQNPGSNYLWNTGDTTQTLTIPGPGIYWVNISNDCGSLSDTVQALVDFPINQIDLGPDTSICAGDSLLLKHLYPQYESFWSNGSTEDSVYVSQPGTYWVRVENSCGSTYDTITINLVPEPSFYLGADTALCAETGNLQLFGPAGMEHYIWSTGDTTPDIIVNSSGLIWLTAYNRCGEGSTDSIKIESVPPVPFDFGPRDTMLCENEELLLRVNSLGESVNWRDGFVGNQKIIDQPGTYSAWIKNLCGFYADTITVQILKEPSTKKFTLEICEGDSAIIELSDPFYFRNLNLEDFQVSWQDSVPLKPTRTIKRPGSYFLELSNFCGTYAQEFEVISDACDCVLHIPNSFRPNGDGRNDHWKIESVCQLDYYDIRILNRWGQQVFYTTDFKKGWDGYFNGEPLKSDVFIYRVKYGYSYFDKEHHKEIQGKINLLR